VQWSGERIHPADRALAPESSRTASQLLVHDAADWLRSVGRDARQAAALTGGRLVELALPGGHLWMFSQWAPFAAELAAAD
jgi:hypothetical protein